jgi:DNA ligase-1
MRRFARLSQRLESVPFHRDRSELLAGYLVEVAERDAAWALYLFSGGALPRALSQPRLIEWALEHTGLPAWLLEECRAQAGDWSETVALLTRPAQARDRDELALGPWIEERILPLGLLKEAERKGHVHAWWREHELETVWAAQCIAMGHFPVRLPLKTINDAVAAALGPERGETLLERVQELARLLSPAPGAAPSRPSSLQMDLFS